MCTPTDKEISESDQMYCYLLLVANCVDAHSGVGDSGLDSQALFTVSPRP